MLEDRHMKDEEEEKIQDAKLLNLFTNMAVCSSKQNKFPSVITYCKRARQFDRSSSKENKAKILFLQGKVKYLFS